MKTYCKIAKDYSKTKKYLDSFVNYENAINYVYKRSLKLRRVRYLLKVLDVSYKRLKVIHVAGTKGKGSVATFIAYILGASGFKVGLYTSPHFKDFRERINILKPTKEGVRNCLIPIKDVIRIVEEFKPILKKLRLTKDLGKLTFFEVYTALAFKYFLENNLDFVVLEVGLGGRLDATNVINPLLSIITNIGYDHTNKLGRRLGDIAYEKSGIIKSNVPVVIGRQRRTALETILKKCHSMGSDTFILDYDFNFNSAIFKENVTRFNFRFGDYVLNDIRISLKGMHQVENASLAIASLKILVDKGIIKKSLDFKKGFKENVLEGRFEIVRRKPLIVSDVAHNVSSFRSLAQTLKKYFPHKKIIIIFAASKDKDVKGMLRCISYDKIIITSFNNRRSLSPAEIKKKCGLKQAILATNIEESLKIAYKYYNRKYLIVVSGSFFLVAEAKVLLRKV